VFADIFFTTKEAYCFDLLRLLVTHVTKIGLILAITSASHHFYSNKELSWPLQTLLAHCLGNVNIARFTENEASSFLEKREAPLKLNGVIHLTGTNPLLLSKMQAGDSVSEFEGALTRYVESNLIQDFDGVVKKTSHFRNICCLKKC